MGDISQKVLDPVVFGSEDDFPLPTSGFSGSLLVLQGVHRWMIQILSSEGPEDIDTGHRTRVSVARESSQHESVHMSLWVFLHVPVIQGTLAGASVRIGLSLDVIPGIVSWLSSVPRTRSTGPSDRFGGSMGPHH